MKTLKNICCFFEHSLFVAAAFSCIFLLPYAIGGKFHQKAEQPKMPAEIMVHRAMLESDAMTDSDCESAEKVLTAYALELRKQGKSNEEIQQALIELAREY